MPDPNSDWQSWLRAHQQPILFAFGGEWQTPEPYLLDAIRGELRGLDALVVVATGSTAFCLGSDDAPAALPALDRRGFETLYRAIRVDPGDAADAALTLTLVDDRQLARMQSKWPGAEEPAVVLESVLAWAGRSLIETMLRTETSSGHVSTPFTRREIVILSLIGALAVPFAGGCEVHDDARRRTSDRAPPPGFLQPTFVQEDALECGQGALSGNLCRCGASGNIVHAIPRKAGPPA
jgi:hypothetical protein